MHSESQKTIDQQKARISDLEKEIEFWLPGFYYYNTKLREALEPIKADRNLDRYTQEMSEPEFALYGDSVRLRKVVSKKSEFKVKYEACLADIEVLESQIGELKDDNFKYRIRIGDLEGELDETIKKLKLLTEQVSKIKETVSFSEDLSMVIKKITTVAVQTDEDPGFLDLIYNAKEHQKNMQILVNARNNGKCQIF